MHNPKPMSPEEQELYLAKLIVRERKSKKTIACLISKAKEIRDLTKILSDPWNYDWDEVERQSSHALDTSLRELFEAIKTELTWLGEILDDIEKIEPGYRTRSH